MVQGHPPRAETQHGAIPPSFPRRIPGPTPRRSPPVRCPRAPGPPPASRCGRSVPRRPRVLAPPAGVPASPHRSPCPGAPVTPGHGSAPGAAMFPRRLAASPRSHVPALLPASRRPPRPQANAPLPSSLPRPRRPQPEGPHRLPPRLRSRRPVLIPCFVPGDPRSSPAFPISRFRGALRPRTPPAPRAAHGPATRRRHSPGGCRTRPTCT